MTCPPPGHERTPCECLPDQAKAFLARHKLENCAFKKFEADASLRRYFRLLGEGQILMVDQQDPVGFASYLRLSRHLNAIGLSTPKVLAFDETHGLALVEDFGDGTYTRCLDAGHEETGL